MTTLAFDTHQAVKALTAAGADETLAEAVVSTIGDAVSGNVATKTDLAKVEAGLKGDIAAVKAELTEVKAELKGDIAAVKAGMAGIRGRVEDRPGRPGGPTAPPSLGYGGWDCRSDGGLSETDGVTARGLHEHRHTTTSGRQNHSPP